MVDRETSLLLVAISAGVLKGDFLLVIQYFNIKNDSFELCASSFHLHPLIRSFSENIITERILNAITYPYLDIPCTLYTQ